ncbi:hypothetical protein JTE90_026775 [Oedothorax gibbosus]|uniref:Uncharacterized protein n=1 Tax=Oedothorax gibbosus TaxID=931172 RepID=A0AAV6UQ59_9ARAC|nr:hypothetical protein JTE90_026775 [Oedothorax gibbosus]
MDISDLLKDWEFGELAQQVIGVFSRIIEVAMEGFGFNSSHESPLTITQEEFERLLDSNFNIDGSEQFFRLSMTDIINSTMVNNTKSTEDITAPSTEDILKCS